MALTLEIITPDGVVWHGADVEAVVLPASDGEIQVLPGHIPLITMLKEGAVGVLKNGEQEELAIDRGYARIMGDVVSVLTEAAIDVGKIDAEEVERAKEDALKAIEEARKHQSVDESEMERLQSVARFAIAQQLAKAKKKS